MKTRVRPLDGGAFSPIAAFVVLLVVLVGVAAFAVSRPDPAQPTATATPKGSPSPPDHSLTDAEAITRFKELDALRIAAFEERDATALKDIFTSGSPERVRGVRTIRRLRRDNVLMKHVPYKTLELRVVRNGGERIQIEQEVLFHIEFLSEDGVKVTTEGRPERLTVRWTLEFESLSWRLANGQVISAEAA